MKKYILKPIVTVPLLIGITLSFIVFFKVWEHRKAAAMIKETKTISNVPLPAGNLINIENKNDYYEAVKNGKVLLLYLTTTCSACKKEAKTLSQAMPDLSSDMQVYGVFIEDRDKVQTFIRETDLKFPVLIDNGAQIFKELQIKYFPTKILLENGVVAKNWFGSAPDKDSILKEFNTGEVK